jgi:hypothetical protein
MSGAVREAGPTPVPGPLTPPEPISADVAKPVRQRLRGRAPRARVAGQGATVTTRHIHIVGGPGSGKTSLATQLAGRTGLSVHHLDNIARIGGGNGPVRSEEERTLLVDAIVAQDGWITEGVHLLWTEPFLERADVIVWLDYVSWRRATGRIVRRFMPGAVTEMRQRRGFTRFTRFRDYGHQLRTLGSAIVEARQYYGPHRPAESVRARPPEQDTLGSWSATAAQLAPYAEKLVHCRSAAEVSAFMDGLR